MTKRRQRGAQILEMALVLPFLLLLVVIVIEAATFIRAHQVINNAAREGARISANVEAKDYIDGSKTNELGVAAVCKYLNRHKAAFSPWPGSTTCNEADGPFQVIVQEVQPTDSDAIFVAGPSYIPSTRAVIRYRYSMKYLPVFSLVGSSPGNDLQIEARSQFRNFYSN